MSKEVLDKAIENVKRGWYVFPVHSVITKNGQAACTCSAGLACQHKGKHPKTPNGFKDASIDERQVREWFNSTAPTNIGIATGLSNLAVLDIDTGKEGFDEAIAIFGDLNRTYYVKTGRGFQFYFIKPNGIKLPAKIKHGFDIKSDGGYVVAPPSLHSSGQSYQTVCTKDPLDFPREILEWIEKEQNQPKQQTAVNNNDLEIQSNVKTVPDNITNTTRNNTLASEAGYLRHRGYSEAEILSALIAINQYRCSPPLEETEVKSIAKSIAKYEPTKNFAENALIKIGYTFAELLNLELPRREEIIKGLGRGENGLLNSITNAGKTTLIRNLALSLICGKAFQPFTDGGKCYRVAIIDSEDTLTFLRYDIQKMISDFSADDKENVKKNLFLICELSFGDEELKLNQKDQFQKIVATLTEFKPDMIFIDTISASFAIRNENDNAEVKEFVMKPLKRLALLTDSPVLASHHIGKAKLEDGSTKEGSHKGRGASAFADLSRAVFNLEKDGAAKTILSCPKLKGDKFTDAILKYDKETRWFEKQGESKTLTNYELLLEIFDEGKGGYKRSEINELLEGVMSKATITRNLSTAVKDGDLMKQKGVYSKNAQMLTPISDE